MGNWKAVNVDTLDDCSIGVQLVNEKDGLLYWYDIYFRDGELVGDWNQYIFLRSSSEDMHRQEVQEDPENCEEAFYEAKDFLERHGYVVCKDGVWDIGDECGAVRREAIGLA